MVARLTCVIAVAVLLMPMGQSVARADDQDLVKQYLEELDAFGYTITPITDDYVGNVLPGSYFGVRFRQWPIAVRPPEGLAPSNVFYVIDSQVYFITNPADLRDFFFYIVEPVEDEDQAGDVGLTWARLSQELFQDGFYNFTAPAVETATLDSGEIVLWAWFQAVPPSGTGEIDVVMGFNASGELESLDPFGSLRIGVRPICQATKLLDGDRIVRGMAEQCILAMGSRAKEYLNEQWARAKPELRMAIERIWDRIVKEER
jgi:hypothetical protein